MHDPAFPQWMAQVQAMPAEQQIEAVSKKLMELNPGFEGKLMGGDGKGTPVIENGVVTELTIVTANVTDISPVRAFVGSKVLTCSGGSGSKGKLSDLSPLREMSLTTLYCNNNWQVSDIPPLQGMALTYLNCGGTQVSDLSPLEDCKQLEGLKALGTKVTPATVAALQKALPNCKIEWDDPAKATTPQPVASGTK
jgi:hypothetical protein